MEITVTNTLVGLEDDVTITCSVLRGNPSNYAYVITNTNTGSTTTGPTLRLNDIVSTDFGTYRCNVTNDAGTGRSDSVTIELGGEIIRLPANYVLAVIRGVAKKYQRWFPCAGAKRQQIFIGDAHFRLYIAIIV